MAVDRRADRLVAMVGVGIALAFLSAAVAATLLSPSVRLGTWLPLHLALAGGASTAISGVMPFFSAAIATAQPVSGGLRWVSVAAVAIGALGVAVGHAVSVSTLAVSGGLAYLTGMALVAYATVVPVRGALGPKGGVVTLGYVMALLMVTAGALLATLYLAGWTPILEAWGNLKPAHAWLNLVGFVSLVIATTWLHFFPTVIGAHIRRSATAYVTVLGLAAGALLVALGFAARSDWLVRGGASVVLVGAAGLAGYASLVWRTRATWTSDRGWHRFAMGGLLCALGWFVVGLAVASGRLLSSGADPTGAGTDVLLGPLVMGWVGLTIVASATHLVPAIGPGDPAAHARQRVLLGQRATVRLVAANAGVAALAIGLPQRSDALVVSGILIVGLSLVWTAGLVLAAILTGISSARAGGNLVA